jgi:hypothetical protein
MRRALAAVFVGLLAVLPCRGRAPLPPPPGPQRLGPLDAVVVGRVVAFEDQDIEASPYPKAEKTTYRVALVTVTQGLIGAKDKQTVRVGFVVPPKLELGQDGLFYMSKHHEEKFFVLPGFFDFTDRKDSTFDDELKTGQLAAKALAKPLEGLKSKAAEERLMTAAVLLYRYRSPRQGVTKTEPIPAQESKLILTALSELDWALPRRHGQPPPLQLFNMLGQTPTDGWDAQKYKDLPELERAARAWLTNHAATYRIQRFAPASNE